MMLDADDVKHSPWYNRASDDKRRARLNCISQLLTDSHHSTPRAKIKLTEAIDEGEVRRSKSRSKNERSRPKYSDGGGLPSLDLATRLQQRRPPRASLTII